MSAAVASLPSSVDESTKKIEDASSSSSSSSAAPAPAPAQRRRKAEFQAVILAGGYGANMYPLTEGTPKVLLPVANAPLISYQIKLLQKAGVRDALVVTVRGEQELAIKEYLFRTAAGQFEGIDINVVGIEEQEDTVPVLRAIKDHIFTDFFLISGDLITEASIHSLADAFRIRDASVVMLLKELDVSKDAIKQRSRESNSIVDYVGLVRERDSNAEHPRVLMLQSSTEDEELAIPKSILKRHPNMEMRTDVSDAHLYVFRRWIMDLIVDKPGLSSVRNDLLPWLVRMQFAKGNAFGNAPPTLALRMSCNRLRATPANDLVRCYALVLKVKGPYCVRVNTVPSFTRANTEVRVHPVGPSTPWLKPESKLSPEHAKLFRKSLIDRGCVFGEKVALKNSVVGKHCKFGDGCKINNCVIMDYVVIGAKAVLQNCVVCGNANVGDAAELNDCKIAANGEAEAGEKLKGEIIARSVFEEFEFE